MSLVTESVEALAEGLAGHAQGQWSDRTYSCHGCARRFEDAAQARFDALDREPTRDELMEFRNGYAKFSHPGWSLAEYSAHVAQALVDSGVVRLAGDVRATAVADFVCRQSVEYRHHSANAIEEDIDLAVREFGVRRSVIYDEPEDRAALGGDAGGEG